MERERKRKRAEKVEASRADNQMKSKGRDAAEEEVAAEAASPPPTEEVAAEAASPPPTEEEVEEFFAILRRMRVAAKYFEKEALNSKSGGGKPQSSTAVEAAADGAKVGGKSLLESGGLDLNAVPDAESSFV